MTKRSSQSSLLDERREIIKSALFFAAIPASLFANRAHAAAPALSEQDPQAKALGYVTDAGKVDAKSNPTFKSGQACANCLQLTGSAGESLRPCNLFPGKSVAASGWCKAWVKKP